MDPSPGREPVPAMPQLHPLIPVGPLDLAVLLTHEPPVRWRPEPGEKVIGELVKVADKTSFGHSAPTLFLLTQADRYVIVRASGVVLRGALGELSPQPGENVAIKYEGMRRSAAGRDYRYHRMAVHRGGSWVTAS